MTWRRLELRMRLVSEVRVQTGGCVGEAMIGGDALALHG